MRHAKWSLGLVLFLQACAYQQAMKRGDNAALARDWDGAYEAYKYANELRPGRAEDAVARARTASAEADVAAAESAVVGKDFAQAVEHLDRARDRDPSYARIEEVRTSARAAMVEELARRTASDPLDATYEFAVLGKRLFPTSPELEDATAALRDRVAAEVQTLIDAGKYAEARATARRMGELEPEQATRSAALDKEVTERWVRKLGDKARDATAHERPGLAAVWYARAFEVSGVEDYKAATQRALHAAAPAGDLAVFVDSKGTGSRHWRVQKAVRTSLVGSPGVKAGHRSEWDLQAMVYTSTERCQEARRVAPMAKDYVAGTRQVPNPAWAVVGNALDQAETALGTAKSELDEAQGLLAEINTEVAALEADRDAKVSAYDEAVATKASSEEQWKDAKSRLSGMEGNRRLAAGELDKQREITAQWTQKVGADEKTVDSARVARDAAKAKLEPAKAEAERRAAVVSTADARRADAQKVATDLTIQKNGTPETLTEDVVKTARYNETTWTLTCSAPATAYFGTDWRTGLARKQSFPAKIRTMDVSHPAHPEAGIAEDPKQYSQTQKEMVAELDQTTEQGIAAAIQAFVAESFDKKVESALAATGNVDGATDRLMTMYVAAPERVDGAVGARIAEYLKSHYGIEDAGLLGVAAVAQVAQDQPVADR